MSYKFVASIADIKYLKDMPEEFMPFVALKATLEKRELKDHDRIAILNVSTTTSYIPIFLDSEKTIEDVEKEVNEASAILNTDTKTVLKKILEEKR